MFQPAARFDREVRDRRQVPGGVRRSFERALAAILDVHLVAREPNGDADAVDFRFAVGSQA
jgi:hypothetical protein